MRGGVLALRVESQDLPSSLAKPGRVLPVRGTVGFVEGVLYTSLDALARHGERDDSRARQRPSSRGLWLAQGIASVTRRSRQGGPHRLRTQPRIARSPSLRAESRDFGVGIRAGVYPLHRSARCGRGATQDADSYRVGQTRCSPANGDPNSPAQQLLANGL